MPPPGSEFTGAASEMTITALPSRKTASDSILCQIVNLPELLLDCLDAPGAARKLGSCMMAGHRLPAVAPWYDRNGDAGRTVREGSQPFGEKRRQISVRNGF